MERRLKMITPDMLASDPFSPGTVDFERDMSAAPLFALALMAANALVFGWELAVGALQSRAAIIAAGAVYAEKVFDGQSWRLLTGTFLHASFGHLLGNCLALYILGLASERAWGRLKSLGIYFVSGLGASLLSATMSTRPSVGASGAIFGLLGAAIIFFYRHRASLNARDRRIGAVLLGWAAFQLVMGSMNPMIDNWAHLGGLAAGLAMGLALAPELRRPARRQVSVEPLG